MKDLIKRCEEFTQDVNEYSYYFEMCFPNRLTGINL